MVAKLKDSGNTPLIDLSNFNRKIFDFIKENIIWCEFPPGKKLDVRKLCKDLGVSYTPVKDALYQLSGEGLVIISPRAGTYVRNITKEDIYEILKVRSYLEQAAVTEVVPKITDGQLQTIRNIYKESLSIIVSPGDIESYKRFLECDGNLHRAIVGFAGNKWLDDTYKKLNVHMQTFRYLRLKGIQGKLPTTDKEHKMIIDALSERDVEKAKEAVFNHIRNTNNSWSKIEKIQD